MALTEAPAALPPHVVHHIRALRSAGADVVLACRTPLDRHARERLPGGVVVSVHPAADGPLALLGEALAGTRRAGGGDVVMATDRVVGPFAQLGAALPSAAGRVVRVPALARTRNGQATGVPEVMRLPASALDARGVAGLLRPGPATGPTLWHDLLAALAAAGYELVPTYRPSVYDIARARLRLLGHGAASLYRAPTGKGPSPWVRMAAAVRDAELDPMEHFRDAAIGGRLPYLDIAALRIPSAGYRRDLLFALEQRHRGAVTGIVPRRGTNVGFAAAARARRVATRLVGDLTDTLRFLYRGLGHPHGTASSAPVHPAGSVSVLVAAGDDWRAARANIEGLLDDPDRPVDIVIADASTRRLPRLVLRSLAGIHGSVRYMRAHPGATPALAWTVSPAPATDRLALVDSSVRLSSEGLARLAAHLDDPGVTAAAPVVLGADGTVASAGLAWSPRGELPEPLFAGHPVEDARRAGRQLRVAATAGGVLVCRAADLAAVGGADPGLGPWAEADLCLRLAARSGEGGVIIDTEVEAFSGASGAGGDRPSDDEAARRMMLARGPQRTSPGHDEILRHAGFVATDSGVTRIRHPIRVGKPTRLRWSIKIAAPTGEAAITWGDVHFARALAAALGRLGQEVVIDHRHAVGRATAHLDEVSLVLRGLDRVPHQPGALNLLWVISHPELVDHDELVAADAVFAAGPAWAREATIRSGRPVIPLLQATDPDRFHPDVAPSEPADEVLFVGNSRGVYRPVVRHLVEAGVDVAVYGSRWERFLRPGVLRATHIPNAELATRYAGAGVVLNDHWEGMRQGGFLSNRLFDAAATGARVVTDHVDGAEETLGGCVRCYRTPDELLTLVRDHRDMFPPEEERRRLAKQVLAEHSFDARATVLVDESARLWPR